MNSGNVWWNTLTNSVRFLDDVESSIFNGRSVVLVFKEKIPFDDIMISELSGRLANVSDSMKFDVLEGMDKNINPGEFLFKKYCREEERQKYWPAKHKCYENFLASSRESSFNHRFICVHLSDDESAEKWIDSAEKYSIASENNENHGIYILIVSKNTDEKLIVPEDLDLFDYDKYVTNYDCMMLCLTMCSAYEDCSKAEKMYLAEVASNISDNNAELAGLLVSEGNELIKKPLSATQNIYYNNNIKLTNLGDVVSKAVWKAQIKLFFPELESFRTEIIQKYYTYIKEFLPIKRFNNNYINNPEDLELGELLYIFRENSSAGRFVKSDEFDMLKKMRDVRNKLAHNQSLTYNELIDADFI